MYGVENERHISKCPIEYVQWIRYSMTNAFEKVREAVKVSAVRQKRSYDHNTEYRSFKRGDWVWVYYMPSDKQKFGQGWKGPNLVVKKIVDLNYRVQETQHSRKITLHVDHIK